MPAELLPHTSPVSWEHISLSGDFRYRERAAAFATGRRSLNIASHRIASHRIASHRIAPGRRLIG